MFYSDSMYKSLKRVILKHPTDAFISQEHLENEWRTYNYVSVPNYDEALAEYEQFEAILKEHVDQIDYLPQSNQVGLDSIYAHDPVKFTPHGAILLNSGKQLRQHESTEYRKFLEEKNIPIVGELTGDAVCDGGDIVWIDERTIAVGRGFRTNDEAINQLRKIMKPFVDEFIEVQLPYDRGPEECLHLMSFISIVDEDLAVVYSPLMPVFFRELLVKRGFTFIEVNAQEYEQLGCNVLALGPRICVLPQGNHEVKRNLELAGAQVYEYKGDEITYKGTGGPTCLTSPVVRA
ncbi:MAG TPA: arginine deiminase family protein [Bacillota bacterium]|nr:arginine deiminase family protein [Bacillota bacterium]